MGKSKTTNQAEARPIGEGKDPLADGNTLVNPSNTDAETHYEVKERSEDVQKAENTINNQDANERAEEHNAQSLPASDVTNGGTEEQNEVAAGREELDANDVPEQVSEATPEPETPVGPEQPEQPADEPVAEPATDQAGPGLSDETATPPADEVAEGTLAEENADSSEL